MGSSVDIAGVPYFTVAAVAKTVRVSRQTLWRWRQEGKVPTGRRYRDKQVLFSAAELEAVRDYANRLEPVDVGAAKQLKLFTRSKLRGA